MATDHEYRRVAGMSGVLAFEDVAEWRYNGGRMVVSIGVLRGSERIQCAVSEEFLEDTYGDAGDILRLAQDHADDITDRIGGMIARGQFEVDGSVLLRSVPATAGRR
jgi:hypothetical protein